MSPATSSTFSSPSAAITDRARRMLGSLKSTPTTRPAGPTISARMASPPMGPAPAVDHRPSRADAHPAQRTPGMLREGLREAQQPPQVVIAAVQDVTPDLVHGRICHAVLSALSACLAGRRGAGMCPTWISDGDRYGAPSRGPT